jgi:trans-2,3-dihydro-3-hydroxyanthranilate isomerase
MRMSSTRRGFMGTLGAATLAARVQTVFAKSASSPPDDGLRRFPYVQVDVFTAKRLQGNPVAVFTDARGLSDSEMQALARETNLQETTFIFPADAEIERQQGVRTRIFYPDGELPFAGHPTLGTAAVLRNSRTQRNATGSSQQAAKITLSLKIGKVPVTFHEDAEGVFGEMRQPEPDFGEVYDRGAVASVIGLKPEQIEPDLPLETVSTGLPYIIVPLKQLSTLQSLKVDLQKMASYLKWDTPKRRDFYYVTRDTDDPQVGLRTRAIFETGEDPATGSAAGCTAAWMVKYGLARPEQTVLVRQGVEIHRPGDLFVRAGKSGETVTNVRVGGYVVPIMQGEVSL